jgi:hypothetical protein
MGKILRYTFQSLLRNTENVSELSSSLGDGTCMSTFKDTKKLNRQKNANFELIV